LIRTSQLSSKIEKMLSAVRCVEQGPAATVQTVQQLDNELLILKTSVSKEFGLSLGDRVSETSPRCGLTMEQFLYVQYAYMTATLSVHTVLAYPWMRVLIGVGSRGQFRDAVARSVDAVKLCAREAIMSTEYIQFRTETQVP
jgi:hypothetical protein